MKRREYAASLGLAIAGARGRLSREALDAIEKARAEGMTFDDDGAAPKSSSPRKPRESTPKPSKSEPEASFHFETRYPIDGKWAGTDSKGKKHTLSARNACMSCGYSLCGHTCNDPVALAPNLEHISVSPI